LTVYSDDELDEIPKGTMLTLSDVYVASKDVVVTLNDFIISPSEIMHFPCLSSAARRGGAEVLSLFHMSGVCMP